MTDIAYMKDMPASVEFDEAEKVVLIERQVWDRISTYNGTLPTSPSAGRVYRRQNVRDPKETVMASGPGNVQNTLYVVRDDPDKPGWQAHHPYKVLVVDEVRA